MNLQHHFLIAMPALQDPFFRRSIIYICEHTDEGAMGLAVNKPAENMAVSDLLRRLKIPQHSDHHRFTHNHSEHRPVFDTSILDSPVLDNPVLDNHRTHKHNIMQPILIGGPLAEDRGFILHSPKSGFNASVQVSAETMITTSQDILESIGTDAQPENMIISLGYSSWQPGQLEHELLENSWLTVEADSTILFHTSIAERWAKAAKKLGVDITKVVSEAGHA